MTEIPQDLRYTAEHEWVRVLTDAVVRVGITDYAQSQLGDVVYVQLPTVGEAVTAGESLAEVESTKSVSDIYSPLTATVTAVNDELTDQPEAVNSDPYGAGWLVELTFDDPAAAAGALGELLDAEGYQGVISD